MSSAPPVQTRRVVLNVIRGSLGNVVEWFDWFVYASFSLYFASAFFPSDSPTAQLLSTSVIFAVGFLMRPLGGWALGLFADRFGRKAALTASVGLMSAGSLLIAVIPTYETIGLLAPILLVVARLAQGLSVGGEFGSSATYLSEVATPGRRGFYSSFQYSSITLGQLLAVLTLIVLQRIFDEQTLTEWAWRIPFVIGALFGLIVFYLRRSMEESPNFVAEKSAEKAGHVPERRGLHAIFREYPKQFFIVIGLAIGGTIAYYTYTTYMTKFLVNTSGISREDAAVISFIALTIFLFLQPLAGALSDRIGRKPIMFAFTIGIIVVTVPVFAILERTQNVFAAFGLQLLGLIFLTGYTSLSAIIKAEQFPTKVRALGVGMPHAIVTAVFGGTTESVALGLKEAGIEQAFYWYVVGAVVLTFIAVLLLKEPLKRSTLDLTTQTGTVLTVDESIAIEKANAVDDPDGAPITSPFAAPRLGQRGRKQ